jgi:hypothetical protein
LNILVTVDKEYMLLELRQSVSNFLAYAAGPAVLVHYPQFLCISLTTVSLVLREEPWSFEFFLTKLADVIL